MNNWSSDLTKWDKKSDEYQIWRLEQLINFGLGEEKISMETYQKYKKSIKIDSEKQHFLSFLIKSK